MERESTRLWFDEFSLGDKSGSSIGTSALSLCLEIDHRVDRRKDHKKSQAKGLVIHERRRSGRGMALCSSEGLNCKLSQAVYPKKADLLIGLLRIKVDDQFWLWSTAIDHRSDSTTSK